MTGILLVLGLIAALLFTTFIIQNTTTVIVHFLFWKLVGSLALVLFLTFLIGVIVCLLIAIPLVLRKRRKIE